MSLTDGGIQPTMPAVPGGGGMGGMFGGDGSWFLIILFLFVFLGWGNGNGNGNNGGGGVYPVRDRMQGGEDDRMTRYSSAPAPEPASESVSRYGDSDFLRAVSGLDQGRAWTVMDELMDTLRVVNSRVYDSVMRKLQ